MAVAQVQHSLRRMVAKSIDRGIKVKYAIHPVAGTNAGSCECASCLSERAKRRCFGTRCDQLRFFPNR